jgi:hypothetical protein
VNVLFFGTSKTYSGVIPQIFDDLVQRAGIQVRAFNAGIDGMRLPETGWFCEQFLARRPPGLKWVFLEVGPVRPKTPPAHEGTRRATLWRDWPRTLQAIQAARHLHAGSADVLQEQLWLGLQRFINLGEGAAWQEAALFPSPPLKGRDLVRPVDRGYTPIPWPMRPKDKAELAQLVASMPAAEPQPLDPVTEAILNDLATRIREAGATPVFLFAPDPSRARAFSQPFLAARPIIWDFARPDLYPELYAPENRSDLAHLNHLGAQLWTTLLARQFAATFRSTYAP